MRSPNSSQVVLPENWQTNGFGLYLHWPFCMAKCPYCDFNSHVVASINQNRWKRAYLAEIARVGVETEGRVLNTVFFGGGTPSLMNPDLVADILEAIRTTWTTANDLEVTLEANPTSIEANRFAGYRDAGVNRVSVGIQALDDADLKALGRLHSAKEALAALEIARNTFDRVSFDLIYARQHQTLPQWRDELHRALSMDPTHLSMYQLTIEDGTAFGDRHKRGRLPGLPNDDLGADLYEMTQEMCNAAGLPAYEVSNHAKPGQESRHNLIYWRSGDWIGIGPGAHGRLTFGDQRWSSDTPLAPANWLTAVKNTGRGEKSREILSPRERLSESLMMGLRISEGVDLSTFLLPDAFKQKADDLADIGLIEFKDLRLKTTVAGRPLINAILRDFFETLP